MTKVATGRQRVQLHCSTIGPDKEIYLHKIVIIFLIINLSMSFGCLKEPSH